jgi:hypothetical protein
MNQQQAYRKIVHLTLFLLAILPQVKPVSAHAPGNEDAPSLELFLQEVTNGDPEAVRGLYVPGVLADAIVEQPEGMPAFVSSEAGVLTRFGMAEEHGTLGLLAHNYLAGEDFHQLGQGEEIVLIYGNGRTETYVVQQILRYQALSPRSVISDFIDLKNGKRLSAADLFQKVYNRPGDLVLQTCIYADEDASWGRLFIIAVPIDEYDARSMPGYPPFQ